MSLQRFESSQAFFVSNSVFPIEIDDESAARLFSVEIILVLPVHNGGAKLKLCVESLAGNIELFSQVVISLNSGAKNQFEEKILDETLQSEDLAKVVLLKQPEVLAPTRHLIAILDSPTFLLTEANRPIMFLFHDDLLLGANLRSFLWKENLDLSGTVVMGPWLRRFEKPDSREELMEGAGKDAKLPGKFLHHSSITPPFTNASGMIAPYAAVKQFAEAFCNSKHGARMEWALIASSHTKNVIAADVPLVSLLDHPGQGGKQLSYEDYQRDELRFQELMLKNSRVASNRLVLVFLARVFWALTVIFIAGLLRYFREAFRRVFR